MEWETLRAAYEALVKRAKVERGVTQQMIATRGGLKRQNVVTKIVQNNELGPSVEVFVRGIEGLGLKPSEFFLQVEMDSVQIATGTDGLRLKADTAIGRKPGALQGRAKGVEHGRQVSDAEVDPAIVKLVKDTAISITRLSRAAIDRERKQRAQRARRAARKPRKKKS